MCDDGSATRAECRAREARTTDEQCARGRSANERTVSCLHLQRSIEIWHRSIIAEFAAVGIQTAKGDVFAPWGAPPIPRDPFRPTAPTMQPVDFQPPGPLHAFVLWSGDARRSAALVVFKGRVLAAQRITTFPPRAVEVAEIFHRLRDVRGWRYHAGRPMFLAVDYSLREATPVACDVLSRGAWRVARIHACTCGCVPRSARLRGEPSARHADAVATRTRSRLPRETPTRATRPGRGADGEGYQPIVRGAPAAGLAGWGSRLVGRRLRLMAVASDHRVTFVHAGFAREEHTRRPITRPPRSSARISF